MYALPNKTQSKLIAKVRGVSGGQNSDYLGSTNLTTIAKSENNNRDLCQVDSSSPFKTSSRAILFKKDSLSLSSPSTTSKTNHHNTDEVGFNAELNNCLPQPVFQHGNNNVGNNKKQKNNNSFSQSFNPFSKSSYNQKQNITPEHNEMIKYVQQSWKGVERDYKKSVNNYINNVDITNSSSSMKEKHKQPITQQGNNKKPLTSSTPLLLSGSYHHTSIIKNSIGNNRQDSFRPFDLETFWGNRIFKRLTEDL